jgi:hypothetical protein
VSRDVTQPQSHEGGHRPKGTRWLNGKSCLVVGVVAAALVCEAAIVTLLMPSRAEIEEFERESAAKRARTRDAVARRAADSQELR